AGADFAHVDFGLIRHRQHRTAFDREWLMRAAAIEWKGIDQTGIFDAGQSFYALQYVAKEIYFATWGGEAIARNGDVHRKHVAGVKAGANIAEVPQRADHQTSADQEHKRKRDFTDDEEIARLGARVGSATRALLERFVNVDARETKRRKESGENASGDGEKQRVGKDLG